MSRPLLYCLLLGFWSCSSGNGQVHVSASTPAPTTTTPPSTGAASSATPKVNGLAQGTVYFTWTQLQADAPSLAKGLGFLPSGSTSTSAFLMSYAGISTLDHPWSARFAPIDGGAVLAQQDHGIDVLRTVHISSLDAQSISGPTSAISTLVTSMDGQWVAWSDASGAAYAYFLASQAKVALDLGASRALRVERLGSGLGVQIQDGTTTQVFSISAQGGTLTTSVPSLQVAMSADERFLAWETPAGSASLTILDRKSKQQRQLLRNGPIRDLAFVGNDLIAFREDDPKQDPRLVIVDPTDIQPESTIPLRLSSSDPEGIVCPVAIGDEIYFGDRDGSSFSIFKASRGSTDWEVKQFAISEKDQQGYLCPQAWNGGTSDATH